MQPDLVRINRRPNYLYIYAYMYTCSICQKDGTLDCEKQENYCGSKEEKGNCNSMEKTG